MDAVEFLNEWKRMCKSFEMCEDCVGEKYCYNPKEATPDGLNNWGKLIPIVDTWSKEHPRKTRLQDFLEKYPAAPVDNDGYPECVCPWHLGFQYGECGGKNCKDCWNEPVE